MLSLFFFCLQFKTFLILTPLTTLCCTVYVRADGEIKIRTPICSNSALEHQLGRNGKGGNLVDGDTSSLSPHLQHDQDQNEKNWMPVSPCSLLHGCRQVCLSANAKKKIYAFSIAHFSYCVRGSTSLFSSFHLLCPHRAIHRAPSAFLIPRYLSLLASHHLASSALDHKMLCLLEPTSNKPFFFLCAGQSLITGDRKNIPVRKQAG